MIASENTRPKIAILTNYPADFISFSGGVETATSALLEGLREYRDEFEFHIISAPQGLTENVVAGHDGFHFHFLSAPTSAWARPRLILRFLKAKRELCHIGPSLVHCQDNMVLALAALSEDRPRVFTIHGVKRYEAGKRRGWERWSASFDAIIERYVHHRFENLICISDYARSVVGHDRTTFHITNAVRSSFFGVHREQTPGHSILLFVGALSPLKRPLDLIRSHNKLRESFHDLETVVIGQTETAGYFQELQGAAIEGVTFAGSQSETELRSWLSRATAFVLPSSQENVPIVIAEAQAAGVLVVATHVGGIPEMIDNGRTGWLYEVGDVDGLTTILEGVLGNPEMASAMGEQARQHALANYHPSIIARQTIHTYQTLLEQHGAKSAR